MKAETPVLRLGKFGAYGTNDDYWVCKWFVRRYFGVLPEKISLEVSEEETEDSVAVNLRRQDKHRTARWSPLGRALRTEWYYDGLFYPRLKRWIGENLNIEPGQTKIFHVSVWIYE